MMSWKVVYIGHFVVCECFDWIKRINMVEVLCWKYKIENVESYEFNFLKYIGRVKWLHYR